MGLTRARHAWLSITPEPERELPAAVATLRAGGPPPAALVDQERVRIERLVTHGSRRSWLAYLEAAAGLARTPGDSATGEARELIEDVIENHHNLALGLAKRDRTRPPHPKGTP